MSRLEKLSKEFRDCTLVLNSCRYTTGDEYCSGSADVLSDGDCRGRDPKSAGGSIGTNLDIDCRGALIAKNSKLYTPGHEYCAGTA